MTTLTFQNKTLSVINQHNQIWLSTTEISKALGYNRSDNLLKLYNSHQDEFTPNMTALVDMQTAGGMQKVRVFSLRGTHLIAMFSHTKVAKDFRKWVLDILDKEVLQNQQQNLPLVEPKPDIVLSYDDAYWIAKYLMRAKAFGKEVETFQRQLFETIGLPRYAGRNDLAAKGYDLAHEFNHKLDPFIEQIFPQTAKVKRLVHTKF